MATINYNGFTSLQHVEISNYETEALLAEDGISQTTTRHHIAGKALLAASTSAAFIALLALARKRLVVPRADLIIQIDGQDVENISAPDDLNGPQAKFTIDEIKGSLTALVTFDITWHLYEKPQTNDVFHHVLSHRWVQTWTVEENGLQIHDVAGTLRVRANAPNSQATTGSDQGPNLDKYRGLVLPRLPVGFRRRRMQFVEDPTHTELIYTIQDVEMAHPLPKPALVGDAQFRYKRSMDAGGILGLKMLSIELEGDRLTNPADLLAAAVRCSQNRIKYAGPGCDQVLSIEIAEIDMFTRNRIRLDVVARGAGAVGDNGVLNPPNFDLLTELARTHAATTIGGQTVPGGGGGGLEPYEPAGPYGSSLIRSMKAALYTPVTAAVPHADWEAATVVKVMAMELPAEQIHTLAASLIPAGSVPEVDPEHTQHPYLRVETLERLQIDSNMLVLQSQSLNGKDEPFQMRRPIVKLITEYTLVRQNAAPEHIVYQMPPGAMILHEDPAMTVGDLDGNNNRIYTTTYSRTVQILNRGVVADTGWGVNTIPLTGGQSMQASRFWPPFNQLGRGIDPRTDFGNGGRSVFQGPAADPQGNMPLDGARPLFTEGHE